MSIKRFHVLEPGVTSQASSTPQLEPSSSEPIINQGSIRTRLGPFPGGTRGQREDVRTTVRPIFREPVGNSLERMVIPDPKAADDYSQFKVKFQQKFPGAQPVPGLDAIGCGYNIFGPYAEKSGLKRQLFDIDKMTLVDVQPYGGNVFQCWSIVNAVSLDKSVSSIVTGETTTKYSQNLSVKAGLKGNYAAFSAEVNVKYSKSKTTSMYSAWVHIFDTVKLWSLRLNDMDNFRDYLKADALNAIDTWPSDRLFDEFGVYFLTGIDMGGVHCYQSCVDMFQMTSMYQAEISAKAAFAGSIGASGTLDATTQESNEKFETNSAINIYSKGGDETKGSRSIIDQATYQAWKDSVSDNPGFIDFTEKTTKRPLTPIWELATGQRRLDLEKQAPDYIARISAESQNDNSIDQSSRKSVTYSITTYTLDERAAGTKSGVWIGLHGVDRFGVEHHTSELAHSGNHGKGQSSTQDYAGIPDIGDIKAVTIKHDGKGDEPAWGLGTVVIQCKQNGKVYTAPINDNFNGRINTYNAG